MNPRVTAVITHWNHPEWLEQSLRSLAAQIVVPHEVIFVDDGSDDPPPADLIEKYIPSGCRLNLMYVGHRGIGASLNRAIYGMQGDVFCWLPADDMWLPDKLRSQAEFASQNPGCILHSHCEVWKGGQYDCLGEAPQLTDAEFEVAIRSSSVYYANTFWIPRTIFDLVGFFREDVPASEDYDWVLRSILKHHVRYRLQPIPLTVKRLHDNRTTIRHAGDIPVLMRQFNQEYDEGANYA